MQCTKCKTTLTQMPSDLWLRKAKLSEVEEGRADLDSKLGVLVRPYVCENCGYVEFYIVTQ